MMTDARSKMCCFICIFVLSFQGIQTGLELIKIVTPYETPEVSKTRQVCAKIYDNFLPFLTEEIHLTLTEVVVNL